MTILNGYILLQFNLLSDFKIINQIVPCFWDFVYFQRLFVPLKPKLKLLMIRPLPKLQLSCSQQSLMVIILKVKYIEKYQDINVPETLIRSDSVLWNKLRIDHRTQSHRSKLIQSQLMIKTLPELLP